MIKKLINFCKDEEGASMVEYGLLVALIALVVAVGATTLGTGINGLFGRANTALTPAAS
jgi:pilus assembly protein Flp/PilA